MEKENSLNSEGSSAFQKVEDIEQYREQIQKLEISKLEEETEKFLNEVNSYLRGEYSTYEKLVFLANQYNKYKLLLAQWYRRQNWDSKYNRDKHSPVIQKLNGEGDIIKHLSNGKQEKEGLEINLFKKMQNIYKLKKIELPFEWLYFLLENKDKISEILRDIRKKQINTSINLDYNDKIINSFLSRINFDKIK
jgi:hypothetical protein